MHNSSEKKNRVPESNQLVHLKGEHCSILQVCNEKNLKTYSSQQSRAVVPHLKKKKKHMEHAD